MTNMRICSEVCRLPRARTETNLKLSHDETRSAAVLLDLN